LGAPDGPAPGRAARLAGGGGGGGRRVGVASTDMGIKLQTAGDFACAPCNSLTTVV